MNAFDNVQICEMDDIPVKEKTKKKSCPRLTRKARRKDEKENRQLLKALTAITAGEYMCLQVDADDCTADGVESEDDDDHDAASDKPERCETNDTCDAFRQLVQEWKKMATDERSQESCKRNYDMRYGLIIHTAGPHNILLNDPAVITWAVSGYKPDNNVAAIQQMDKASVKENNVTSAQEIQTTANSDKENDVATSQGKEATIDHGDDKIVATYKLDCTTKLSATSACLLITRTTTEQDKRNYHRYRLLQAIFNKMALPRQVENYIQDMLNLHMLKMHIYKEITGLAKKHSHIVPQMAVTRYNSDTYLIPKVKVVIKHVAKYMYNINMAREQILMKSRSLQIALHTNISAQPMLPQLKGTPLKYKLPTAVPMVEFCTNQLSGTQLRMAVSRHSANVLKLRRITTRMLLAKDVGSKRHSINDSKTKSIANTRRIAARRSKTTALGNLIMAILIPVFVSLFFFVMLYSYCN